MTTVLLDDISFSHPDGGQLFHHLHLAIGSERVGFIGPNGSGKTTLFHIIMGLIKPDCGRVVMDDKVVADSKAWRQLRRQIGFLFQDADDQLFSPTVLEDVAFGPLNMGCDGPTAKSKAIATLNSLGLADFDNRITHKLSGGEKKLVALATILVMEPDILLLDEPTNNLDPATRERLVAILAKLNLPMVIISHDFDFLAKTTDVIYSLEHGHLHKSESIHLHTHPHAHVYGDHPHDHGG
ncbi:MAG: energy-coupling factor ABC transporter ATP-binding protein [Proteobacteria bacterium]|nr:energy-coupling factor ABC transporter ATP-binding protein [Pseudomonadota bacterium]MBU1640277.1 energy-coupling factor ABC transporter ATP-binding protein [Pseudomonadota bacterium]